MPRPLIYQDGLRELPGNEPMDVGAARTAGQALTPAQVTAGKNVTVAWENGVLTISAVGGGTVEAESVADRLAQLSASGFAATTAALQGGGPGFDDSGARIAPDDLDARGAAGLANLSATTTGADFAWIMITNGAGANQHAFTVAGNDAGDWAGVWRTHGNWRGLWVYRHRDDVTRLCYFDPETSAWTFAVWPAGSVFPDYPDGWVTRAERTFAIAVPGTSDEPPISGYLDGNADPLDFELDFDFIPLTGTEIRVSGSATAVLNGTWLAVGEERYSGRRYYRPAGGGMGIIYYYGPSSYGWILYTGGSSPGGGPPNEHSRIPDDSGDPNTNYLAPVSAGYQYYGSGSTTATTVTVTA